jgi:hypothetical protein
MIETCSSIPNPAPNFESGNADMVISGQYVRFGDQIRIDASLQDLKHDRRIPLKNEAAGEKDIQRRRSSSGVDTAKPQSPDVIKELQAQAFRPGSIPSSRSVLQRRPWAGAARQYLRP